MHRSGSRRPGATAGRVIRSKKAYRFFGVLAIILGVLAILFPTAVGVSVEIALGLVLAAMGVIELVRVFFMRGEARVGGNVILAVLALAAGVLLVMFPLQGVLSLTLVFSAFFIAGGVAKLIYAFQVKEEPAWTWLAVSGALSILLGVVLWTLVADAALWAFGLLLGVDLIVFGVAQLMFANRLELRRASTSP